jgi:hypothetical protein
MAGESRSSPKKNDTYGVNIGGVGGGIHHSNIAGGDINNITLIIRAITEARTSSGDHITDEVGNRIIHEVRGVLEKWRQDTIQELSKLMSDMSSQSAPLSLGQLERHLENSLGLTRQYRQLSQAKGLLGGFTLPPQAMMVTEPITFVFGGEKGEEQPAIHIAKAIRENRIRVNFRGLNTYDRISAAVERDPSFSGPLKVILPRGTCIYPEGGEIGFSSFSLPKQEMGAGRVVHIE